MSTRVEVITYAPTVYTHCQHCEVTFREAGLAEHSLRDQARESLPPDLLMEFQEISDWVHDLTHRYGDAVEIHLVDVVSVQGVIKSLLHRTRRYPSVVVDGTTYGDLGEADAAIAERIATTGGNGRGDHHA
jgi:hypothetical protein